MVSTTKNVDGLPIKNVDGFITYKNRKSLNKPIKIDPLVI